VPPEKKNIEGAGCGWCPSKF